MLIVPSYNSGLASRTDRLPCLVVHSKRTRPMYSVLCTECTEYFVALMSRQSIATSLLPLRRDLRLPRDVSD
jgi:hypothetical protein